MKRRVGASQPHRPGPDDPGPDGREAGEAEARHAEPGKEPRQREMLADMPPGPFNEARRAYIRGDMKLIVAGGVRYQLFDLATDPGEKKDLSSDKELLAEERKHYDQFRARLREVPLRPPRK